MRLIDADALLEDMGAGCIPIVEKGISGVTGDEKTIKDYIDTQPSVRQWIPVSERLPSDCEKEVEVTVERRYENKAHYSTCRAIYEDGNRHISESIFNWYDFDIEDERVPKGWFEAVSYAEEFRAIDDFVIAWRPLPEPYQPK